MTIIIITKISLKKAGFRNSVLHIELELYLYNVVVRRSIHIHVVVAHAPG